jgi:hypothetical protein
LWDARPNVGITSGREWAGAAQGNTDLFQWRSANDQVMTSIGSDGHIQTPQLRLSGTGTQPACSASMRGTFWFVPSPSGVADHLQVCSKSAADSYSWVSVF